MKKSFVLIGLIFMISTPCFPFVPYLHKEIFPTYPFLEPFANVFILVLMFFAATSPITCPAISFLLIYLLIVYFRRKAQSIPFEDHEHVTSKSNTRRYNPWISMWFQPRVTIRQIVDTNANEHTSFLAIVAGIYSVLDYLYGKSPDIGLIFLLAASLIIGSIMGLVGIRLIGALLYWRSRHLGGNANTEEIRAAIAWSTVPDLFLTIILIPAIIINGGSTVTPNMLTFAIIMNLVGLVLLIWRVILLIACITEVNQMSIWDGVKVVAILLPFIPFILWMFAS